MSLKSRGIEKQYLKKNCRRVMKVGTKDILKQRKLKSYILIQVGTKDIQKERKIENLHTDASIITHLKFKPVSKR